MKTKTKLGFLIGISVLEFLAWSSWYDNRLGGLTPLHGWHLYATRTFWTGLFLFVVWLVLDGPYQKGYDDAHQEANDTFDDLVERGLLNMDDVFADAHERIRQSFER